MIALTDRLVFGTARLAGGAYAARSGRMIEHCINAGITRFDAAPSYGMGASEQLLGMVTEGHDEIALHTKVGSLRPSFPALRGWAKWLRNLAPNRAPLARINNPVQRFAAIPFPAGFAPEAIAGSLARSRELLRRERIELVLLHETEPQLITPEAWNVLQEAQDQGAIGQLGFAHGGPLRCTAPALIGQTAPVDQDFVRGEAGENRIFHSVRRSLHEALLRNSAVATAAGQVSSELGLRLDNAAHQYIVGLWLLARNWPAARLIFATSQPDHLAELLRLVKQVEGR